MPFKKGQSGNIKGRPNGAGNKTTVELKNWIQALIDNNRRQLKTDLKALEPMQRWTIIEKLMSYTIPKLQNVEANLEFDGLNEDAINRITTELLNTLQNDNTRKRNKN